MLNETFRITPLDAARSTVSWDTPWPDGASWVFVNGKHIAGPHVTGAAARAIRVPLIEEGTAAIEVHDFPDPDALAEAIEIPPNTRPMLIWRDVAEAVRFRIYHRERDEVAEVRIFDAVRRQGLERHQVRCPVKLSGQGGIWHYLRVEAVDEFGNESARESWVFFATEPPLAPAIAVTPGSLAGLYTVTVE